MRLKRYLVPTAVIVVVLALLYAAVWHHDNPQWHALPEKLTTPDPSIDRSRIPLGPYTVDFSGLIGGPTGDKRVTFYVVMRPGDVHFQRVGEVGKKLDGASVIGLGIRYIARDVPPQIEPRGSKSVDGLELLPSTISSRPAFTVPNTRDTSGQPIKIICSLFDEGRATLIKTQSLRGIKHGMCTVMFRPSRHLHAFMGGVQPPMFPSMSLFLPEIYQATKERIQGELN